MASEVSKYDVFYYFIHHAQSRKRCVPSLDIIRRHSMDPPFIIWKCHLAIECVIPECFYLNHMNRSCHTRLKCYSFFIDSFSCLYFLLCAYRCILHSICHLLCVLRYPCVFPGDCHGSVHHWGRHHLLEENLPAIWGWENLLIISFILIWRSIPFACSYSFLYLCIFAFSGIGFATQVIAAYLNVYYVVILAWAIFYFFNCFTTELPWAACGHYWNTGRGRESWMKEEIIPVCKNNHVHLFCFKMKSNRKSVLEMNVKCHL